MEPGWWWGWGAMALKGWGERGRRTSWGGVGTWVVQRTSPSLIYFSYILNKIICNLNIKYKTEYVNKSYKRREYCRCILGPEDKRRRTRYSFVFVCLFRVPLFRLFSVYVMENTNVNPISVAILSILLSMRIKLYFLYMFLSKTYLYSCYERGSFVRFEKIT